MLTAAAEAALPPMPPVPHTLPQPSWSLAGHAGPAPWHVWRVKQWRHFIVLPLAAIEPDRWLHGPAAALAAVVPGLAVAALLLGAAYGWNACADAATDRDVHKNPWAGHRVPVAAWAWSWGAAVGALALALASGGPAVLAAASLSLGASWGYSLGPRWKSRPGAGALVNTWIFVPLLAAAGGAISGRIVALAIVLAVLLLQNQLLHECEDRAEDAAAQDRTTARWLGERWTRRLVAVLGVAIGIAVLTAGVGGRGPTAVHVALGVALAGGTIWSLGASTAAATRARHRRVAFVCGAAAYGLGASVYGLGA